MVVSSVELGLVHTMKRRQMRLPLRRRSLHVGAVHTLRAPRLPAHDSRRASGLQAPGEKPVTITISALRREPLESMSPSDAKREGYGSRQGAIDAYRALHGDADQVNVVDFVLGAHEIGDRPTYLARVGGDYTTSKALALPNEPEIMPTPSEAEKARIAAIARTSNPQYEALGRIHRDLETLAESLKGMKARGELRRAKYALDQIEAQIHPHDLLKSLSRVAS